MQEDYNNIFNQFLNLNHHAFLLEVENRDDVFNFFQKKISENTENKSEYIFINLKVFDISKAREILSYGNIKFEKKIYFVLSFYSMTREAQNALLKFLEDTPQNIKIILITISRANILNTIKSRTYKLDLEGDQYLNQETISLVEKFLSTKKIDRINIKKIQDILNKKDEYAEEFDKKERLDREGIDIFLTALHKNLYEKYIITKNIEILKDLEKLNEFIKYIKNNSSSGKTILEYLALKLE